MMEKSTKTTALIIAVITTFASPFMVSAINIAMPAIQQEFSVHAILLSWTATSYILAMAVFLVPTGKLADIYGRKKVFCLGVILFTSSTFLCAYAGSIRLLIALRVFQGIGAAMVSTTNMAIITSVFPVHERGKAIGITVASVYTGLSAGPFFGGLLTQYFGWQSIFLVSVPFGILTLLLTVLFLKGEWADAKGEQFDIAGSLIYSFSLTALMYGAANLPEKIAVLSAGIGITGLFLFALYELQIQNPVFEIRLFRYNKVFAFSCLAALISYAATFGITFLLSLYLQYIIDLTPRAAGALLVVQPMMQALLSPFAGKLSDRIEPGILASAGMGITVLGLFLLLFINPQTTILYFIIDLAILGTGFALFSSPNMNAIMSSVEKKYYGIASGSVATMRTVGMTFSMAVVAVVFALHIGKSEITPATYPEFMQSVKTALILFTALCTIGIYFSSARGNLRQQKAV